MALFSKENKEDKKAAKAAAILEAYGLESVSDPLTVQALRNISNSLAGNSLIEFGTILSGKAEDVAIMSYLRAIVEQNFIIIRQLDKLAK